MAYSVKASDIKSISLGLSDRVASVLQNVAIILGTWQGSVPLYREFGLPRNFQDKPLEVAKALIVSEIETYIPQFEPRAKIKRISFEADEETPGRLIPIVEVEIEDE